MLPQKYKMRPVLHGYFILLHASRHILIFFYSLQRRMSHILENLKNSLFNQQSENRSVVLQRDEFFAKMNDKQKKSREQNQRRKELLGERDRLLRERGFNSHCSGANESKPKSVSKDIAKNNCVPVVYTLLKPDKPHIPKRSTQKQTASPSRSPKKDKHIQQDLSARTSSSLKRLLDVANSLDEGRVQELLRIAAQLGSKCDIIETSCAASKTVTPPSHSCETFFNLSSSLPHRGLTRLPSISSSDTLNNAHNTDQQQPINNNIQQEISFASKIPSISPKCRGSRLFGDVASLNVHSGSTQELHNTHQSKQFLNNSHMDTTSSQQLNIKVLPARHVNDLSPRGEIRTNSTFSNPFKTYNNQNPNLNLLRVEEDRCRIVPVLSAATTISSLLNESSGAVNESLHSRGRDSMSTLSEVVKSNHINIDDDGGGNNVISNGDNSLQNFSKLNDNLDLSSSYDEHDFEFDIQEEENDDNKKVLNCNWQSNSDCGEDIEFEENINCDGHNKSVAKIQNKKNDGLYLNNLQKDDLDNEDDFFSEDDEFEDDFEEEQCVSYRHDSHHALKFQSSNFLGKESKSLQSNELDFNKNKDCDKESQQNAINNRVSPKISNESLLCAAEKFLQEKESFRQVNVQFPSVIDKNTTLSPKLLDKQFPTFQKHAQNFSTQSAIGNVKSKILQPNVTCKAAPPPPCEPLDGCLVSKSIHQPLTKKPDVFPGSATILASTSLSQSKNSPNHHDCENSQISFSSITVTQKNQQVLPLPPPHADEKVLRGGRALRRISTNSTSSSCSTPPQIEAKIKLLPPLQLREACPANQAVKCASSQQQFLPPPPSSFKEENSIDDPPSTNENAISELNSNIHPPQRAYKRHRRAAPLPPLSSEDHSLLLESLVQPSASNTHHAREQDAAALPVPSPPQRRSTCRQLGPLHDTRASLLEPPAPSTSPFRTAPLPVHEHACSMTVPHAPVPLMSSNSHSLSTSTVGMMDSSTQHRKQALSLARSSRKVTVGHTSLSGQCVEETAYDNSVAREDENALFDDVEEVNLKVRSRLNQSVTVPVGVSFEQNSNILEEDKDDFVESNVGKRTIVTPTSWRTRLMNEVQNLSSSLHAGRR